MIRFSKNSDTSIKLECANDSVFQSMRDSFAVENPAAKFVNSPFVQTKFYAISPMGVLKPGLLKDVYEKAKILVGKENIQIDADVAPIAVPSKLYISSIPDQLQIRSLNKEILLRPQQTSAIHQALRFGRAVVISPTGSGKGMIIFGVIDQLIRLIPDFNYVLLTVPNVQLTKQLREEAIKYGFAESDVVIHDSKNRLTNCRQNVDLLTAKQNSPKIVIANRAFLQQKENFKIFLYGATPSAVLVDEVHTVKKSAVFSKLVDNLKTPFKFGFTGTISSAKYDEYQMKGLIGPIVYEESITNLQNEGILSQIEIWNLVIRYSKEDLRRFDYFNKMSKLQERRRDGKVSKDDILPQVHIEEFKMLYCDHWMQNVIDQLVKKLGSKNTLILYDSTEIGDRIYTELQNRLLEGGYKVYQISGRTPVEERTYIQKNFELQDKQVLIAQTQTFSTGINIRNIHNIIFAFSSKSFVKIIQSIGRGLRTLENKQFLRLIDISSNLKYSMAHLKIRNELYYENYGKNDYEIRKLILDYGKDIDMTKIGDSK